MTDRILTRDEVVAFIDANGPSLGYDHTYPPVFPEGRQDVCAVRRLAENGTTYGYDTLYVVWKNRDGNLLTRKVCDSKGSKDYIDITKVSAEGDSITVEYGSGGSYSGKPWSDQKVVRIE